MKTIGEITGCFPVNFAKYDTMGTYIEDNIRIALLNLFEVGFTLKGYKVKKR